MTTANPNDHREMNTHSIRANEGRHLEKPARSLLAMQFGSTTIVAAIFVLFGCDRETATSSSTPTPQRLSPELEKNLSTALEESDTLSVAILPASNGHTQKGSAGLREQTNGTNRTNELHSLTGRHAYLEEMVKEQQKRLQSMGHWTAEEKRQAIERNQAGHFARDPRISDNDLEQILQYIYKLRLDPRIISMVHVDNDTVRIAIGPRRGMLHGSSFVYVARRKKGKWSVRRADIWDSWQYPRP